MTTSTPHLTIDALAEQMTRQFAAMQAEIDILRQENAQLRAAKEVSSALHTDRSTHLEPQSEPSPLERLSRRWLLRRGVQLTAASVVAGVLAPREVPDARANHSDDIIMAKSMLTHKITVNPIDGTNAVYAGTNASSVAAIHAKNDGTGPGLLAESASANGAVEGVSLNANGSGVTGFGRNGVIGSSAHADGTGVLGDGAVGVKGTSSKSNYAAVAGDHTGTVGYGVSGVGKGTAAGVLGRNPAGEGVLGEGRVGVKGTGPEYVGVHGDGKTGVWGTTISPDYSGVYGQSFANGYGVYGTSPSKAGVHGACAGGFGVQGVGRSGVHGKATGFAGYGGQFEGGKAQLRIVPKTTAGKPTGGTHVKGELLLDSAATLWICTVGGTPGTWRKVSTTAS